MENREVILARLHAAAQRLPQYESEYQNLNQRDYDHVYPLVQGYILDRFLLTEEMCASEKLLDLADVSLRYMLALKRMGIDPGQISRSCSGASSVISKKVLLMKAVQEIFHVSMTPAEFAEISTVSELAAFICSQPQENTVQKLVVQEKYTEEVAHSFDVGRIRQDFPALSQTIHGHPLVYLDNAATMQMPVQVMEAVREVELLRGNVHRGIHTLSSRCTDAYEQARAVCAQFFGTEPGHITFTSGTTDGINRVAAAFADRPGAIVVTELEHHSNFVPWQQLCKKTGREFRICPIQPDGTLNLDALEAVLTEGTALLAISQCSNVLGMAIPLEKIIPMAHSRGIPVLVDGAQGACHMSVNLTALDCDYYVCSGHKLGAPFGVGLLYCKQPLPPMVYGGGMVERVTAEKTTFLPTLEAGTPNVSGAVGLATALEYRMQLPSGWQTHEAALLRHAETRLREIPGIHFLGSGTRVGCLSFTVDGVDAFDLAAALDQLGIMLRSGDHCAQMLHRKMGIPYSLRLSPAFYNTFEEMELLAEATYNLPRQSK